MFTKPQLIELFKGIVYFNNDHKTHRSIALTCKDFAKIAHEYMPMKKNEFRKLKEYYRNQIYNGWFLPNGCRHEIVIKNHPPTCAVTVYNSGFSKDLMYIKEGSYIDINSSVLHMLINKTYYIINTKISYVEGINYKYNFYLKFYFCGLCNALHGLDIVTNKKCNKNEHNLFVYYYDCVIKTIYSKTYKKYQYHDYIAFSNVISKIKKRNKIIKSVIKYAKNKNKQK